MAEDTCSSVGVAVVGQLGTEQSREIRIDPDGFGYRNRRGDVVIARGEPLGYMFPRLLPQRKVTLGRKSNSLWHSAYREQLLERGKCQPLQRNH